MKTPKLRPGVKVKSTTIIKKKPVSPPEKKKGSKYA